MDMQSKSRAIDKVYKRRDRYEIPEWQREEVWSEDSQRKLIDTILRGWHLPKFYFLASDTEEGYFEVVDGQQRLSAIWAFMDGDLTLDTKSAKKHGG
ncbi:MAG: DUF262 domain-containing protein, partial [Chloroflexi bacterium]|nr:DUF262 domain-containing protein [Chloroflexota bacterium]